MEASSTPCLVNDACSLLNNHLLDRGWVVDGHSDGQDDSSAKTSSGDAVVRVDGGEFGGVGSRVATRLLYRTSQEQIHEFYSITA